MSSYLIYNVNSAWKQVSLSSKPTKAKVKAKDTALEVYCGETKADDQTAGYWMSRGEELTVPVNVGDRLYIRCVDGPNGTASVLED